MKKSISFSFIDNFEEALESQLVISLISSIGDSSNSSSDSSDDSVLVYEEVSLINLFFNNNNNNKNIKIYSILLFCYLFCLL